MSGLSPILLAEDDDNDALLLERAFVKAGWTVPIHRASDGEEVIEYLRLKSEPENSPIVPSMLLLDLRLPRKSGFEVLEWMQTQSHLDGLLVVVLTSWKVPADVRRAYDLGVNMFLVKSAKFDALVEHLQRLQSHWLFHQQTSSPETQRY